MILAPDCRSKNCGPGMGASHILVVCLLCLCANEVSFFDAHAECVDATTHILWTHHAFFGHSLTRNAVWSCVMQERACTQMLQKRTHSILPASMCESVRARRCCKITPANRRCCCASFSAHTRTHTSLLDRSLLLSLSPSPSRFHHIPSPSVVARRHPTYASIGPSSGPMQSSRATTAHKNSAVLRRRMRCSILPAPQTG